MTTRPSLQRLPDWPERLAAHLASHSATPFVWGSHDCVRFAAGAVHAITGRHILPADWSDRAEAARLLRSVGGLVPAVDAVLPRLWTTTLAQRGDVLMVCAPGPAGGWRHWLAVCDGARWWAPSPQGLACGPAAQAVHAWGVAHG